MKILPLAAILLSSPVIMFAAEEGETEAPKTEEVTVTRGTRLYDAESVKDLFKTYKAENEKRAEEAANTEGFEDMEVFDFKEIEVRANRIANERALYDRLDPQPQNRIRRLARIDPKAAFDVQSAVRNDEVFFSGAHDGLNDGSGSTGNLSVTQMADALDATFDKIGKLFGGKKKKSDGR